MERTSSGVTSSLLVLILTGCFVSVSGWNLTRSEVMQISSNRNVYLLIFLPVHHKGSTAFSCGPANGSEALSQLITISHAINSTNEESLLRTGITLGAYVIDYCSQPIRAATTLYRLLSGETTSGVPIDARGIIGVVSLENDVTEDVKELLESQDIPLISGMIKPEWKTPSAETSNEMRLVTPSHEWIDAVASFLMQSKMEFISLLVSGDFGARAKEALLSRVQGRVCTVNSFQLMHESEMKSLARTIATTSEGHVIVILSDDDQLVLKFLNVYAAVAPSSLQLFVIDNRLLSSKTVRRLQANVLLVGSAPDYASKEAENFARKLNIQNREPINNEWFRELWQYHFRCTLSPTSSWPLCTGREDLADNFTQTPAMDYTYLAIKTLSLGFQNFITRNCPKRDQIGVVEECGPRARSLLVHETTRALVGDRRLGQQPLLPHTLAFQLHYKDSAVPAVDHDVPSLKQVASWANGSISLVEGIEHSLRRAGVVDFPCVDVCARACPDKAVQMTATDLDPGTNFRETWGLVTSILSALGILLAIGCFAYLLVVVPTSRGTTVLNYVILVGLLGVFGANFFFVAIATEAVCSVRRFLMGFAYAVIFSAKLIKVIYIWRTSRHQLNSTTSCVAAQQTSDDVRPSFIVVVAMGIALFQGGIAVAWLILSPSHVLIVGSSVLCSPGSGFEEAFVISLLYVMLLIFLTLVFASLTWKYESNQRESRWILLSTLLTSFAWVLWTLVATQGEQSSRNPSIVVGNILCGFSIIATVFIPKLYLYSKLLNQAKKLDIRAFYPQRRSFRGQTGVSTLYDPLHPSSTINSNYSSVSGTLTTTASNKKTKKQRPAPPPNQGSLPRRPQDLQHHPPYPRPVYDGKSQFLVEQQTPYPLASTNGINCILPHSRTVHNPGVEYF